MTTMIFTDPREAAVYIDRFEDRSILPLQAYLWEKVHEDGNGAEVITPVRREELDWMVIDDTDELRIDAAVYVKSHGVPGDSSVLVLSHVQREGSDNPWDTTILLFLRNKIEAENFTKQIAGEAAIAFSVVESS